VRSGGADEYLERERPRGKAARIAQLAGLADDVANPPGGGFVRDASGKLTGAISDNVALLEALGAAPVMARLEPVPALVGPRSQRGRPGLTCVSERYPDGGDPPRLEGTGLRAQPRRARIGRVRHSRRALTLMRAVSG